MFWCPNCWQVWVISHSSSLYDSKSKLARWSLDYKLSDCAYDFSLGDSGIFFSSTFIAGTAAKDLPCRLLILYCLGSGEILFSDKPFCPNGKTRCLERTDNIEEEPFEMDLGSGDTPTCKSLLCLQLSDETLFIFCGNNSWGNSNFCVPCCAISFLTKSSCLVCSTSLIFRCEMRL